MIQLKEKIQRVGRHPEKEWTNKQVNKDSKHHTAHQGDRDKFSNTGIFLTLWVIFQLLTSCFICLLLLEMTALRLKGPSLALIDLGIYSEPLGSFYTPANSMATICPYHYPHHGPISESGSRIREGRENGKRWFGWCLWFPLLLPFPSLQPSFSESHAWLIMEQSCSPLICVCHMSRSKPPRSYGE